MGFKSKRNSDDVAFASACVCFDRDDSGVSGGQDAQVRGAEHRSHARVCIWQPDRVAVLTVVLLAVGVVAQTFFTRLHEEDPADALPNEFLMVARNSLLLRGLAIVLGIQLSVAKARDAGSAADESHCR